MKVKNKSVIARGCYDCPFSEILIRRTQQLFFWENEEVWSISQPRKELGEEWGGGSTLVCRAQNKILLKSHFPHPTCPYINRKFADRAEIKVWKIRVASCISCPKSSVYRRYSQWSARLYCRELHETIYQEENEEKINYYCPLHKDKRGGRVIFIARRKHEEEKE